MNLYKLKYNYCYTHDIDTEFEADNDAKAALIATEEVNQHNLVQGVKLYRIGFSVDLCQCTSKPPCPHSGV